MKLALVQQHVTSDKDENIQRGVAALEAAATNGADLIAFAELGFEPFYPRRHTDGKHLSLAETIPGPMTTLFASKAKELGVVIVLNLFERDGNKTYDSSPVIDSDGSLLGVTRMMHITDYKYFHERDYYSPAAGLSDVYDTAVGRIGVAICYDRHYPEYMRALKLKGVELVVIPQAGTVGEWPEGLYESEVRVAAFQNGYFAALVNRVGREEELDFSGESFICAPDGKVIGTAPAQEDATIYADLDFATIRDSHAEKFFLRDRRAGSYEILS